MTLTAGEDSLLGPAGTKLPAHEFHYWDCTENGTAFLAKKPAGTRSWHCMVNRGTLLAGFPHIYYYGNPSAAEHYLSACLNYRRQREARPRTGRMAERDTITIWIYKKSMVLWRQI